MRTATAKSDVSGLRALPTAEPKPARKPRNPWARTKAEQAQSAAALEAANRRIAVLEAQARAVREAQDDEPTAPPGVVEQVRIACRPENRLASLLGACLGAGVPVASYQLAHCEIDASRPLWAQLTAWLVAGGLLYSCTSVYSWGRVAFGSAMKALGFCVLLEGVLVAARTNWLGVAALVYLAAINAVVAGCKLALEKGTTSRS